MVEGDKAYVGARNITTPHKKPRLGELTAQQKAENKLISRNRFFVEHLIRLLKILADCQGEKTVCILTPMSR